MANRKREKCEAIGCFEKNIIGRKYCRTHWNEHMRRTRPKKRVPLTDKQKQERAEIRKMKRKKYKKDNHDRLMEHQRKYKRNKQEKIRQEVFLKIGNGKCHCCNESNQRFLTLHHVNHDGYLHRKERTVHQIYKDILDGNCDYEIIVLCYNCNCGIQLSPSKICPHKTEEDNAE